MPSLMRLASLLPLLLVALPEDTTAGRRQGQSLRRRLGRHGIKSILDLPSEWLPINFKPNKGHGNNGHEESHGNGHGNNNSGDHNDDGHHDNGHHNDNDNHNESHNGSHHGNGNDNNNHHESEGTHDHADNQHNTDNNHHDDEHDGTQAESGAATENAGGSVSVPVGAGEVTGTPTDASYDFGGSNPPSTGGNQVDSSYVFNPSTSTGAENEPALPPAAEPYTVSWQIRLVLVGARALASENTDVIAANLKELLTGYKGSVNVKFITSSARRRMPWEPVSAVEEAVRTVGDAFSTKKKHGKKCSATNGQVYIPVSITGDQPLRKQLAKKVVLEGVGFKNIFTTPSDFCGVYSWDFRVPQHTNEWQPDSSSTLQCGTTQTYTLGDGQTKSLFTLTPGGNGTVTASISTCNSNNDVSVTLGIYTIDPDQGDADLNHRLVKVRDMRTNSCPNGDTHHSTVSVSAHAEEVLYVELVSSAVDGGSVEMSVQCDQ